MATSTSELAVLDPTCCGTAAPLFLEAAQAEQLAGLLKAVADPARLRLLSLIAGAAGGETCVCNLTAPVGLSQPTVSHHLRVLVEAGLLIREQRGKWAYYRLVDDAVAGLAASLLNALAVAPATPGTVAHR